MTKEDDLRKTVPLTPLPKVQITIVILVQVCEAMNINVLFPFVAFMVEDLGYGGSQLGVYAGGLAASFCGAQFCSSILWGMFSDKYGRKPSIAIGTLGAAAGMIIFGCSTTYTSALVGRLISGLLSGNLGVLKSFLTEITDESNRGAGFSYMSVAWALGCIVAPLAGGLLCKPADKYPKYFDKSGIFGTFPYLLPCLICALFNVASAITCQLFMLETRKPIQKVATDSINTKDLSLTASGSVKNVPFGRKDTLSGDKDHTSELSLPAIVEGQQAGRSGGLLGRALSNVGASLQTSKTFVQQRLKTIKGNKYNAVSRGGADDEDGIDLTDAYCEDDASPLSADSGITDDESPRSGIEEEILISETSTNHSILKTQITSSVESPLSCVSDDDISVGDVDEEFSTSSDGEDSDEDELCCCFSNNSKGSTSVNSRSRETLRRNTDIKYNPLPDTNKSDTFTIDMLDDDADDDSTTVASSLGYSSNDTQANRRGVGENKIKIPKTKPPRKKNVLQSRNVVLVTCNYGVLAMAFILWEETIPLFLKLDISQGGFGLSSSDIGLLLSSSGGFMLVFTYLVLPSLASRSKKWLFRLGICSALPITFAIPILATVKATYPETFQSKEGLFFLWILLIFCCVLKNIAACIAFTAMMIMLNNSVFDESLGVVNGLGQSLASLARMVGPGFGGILWSISIETKFVWTNFIAVFFSLIACLLINNLLPNSLDLKKMTREQKILKN